MTRPRYKQGTRRFWHSCLASTYLVKAGGRSESGPRALRRRRALQVQLLHGRVRARSAAHHPSARLGQRAVGLVVVELVGARRRRRRRRRAAETPAAAIDLATQPGPGSESQRSGKPHVRHGPPRAAGRAGDSKAAAGRGPSGQCPGSRPCHDAESLPTRDHAGGRAARRRPEGGRWGPQLGGGVVPALTARTARPVPRRGSRAASRRALAVVRGRDCGSPPGSDPGAPLPAPARPIHIRRTPRGRPPP